MAVVSSLSPRDPFAVNLRRARWAASVTQEALAERCDLHRTEISLLERGGREPRLGTIVKLAGSLGVTAQALCAGIDWDEQTRRFRYEEREKEEGG